VLGGANVGESDVTLKSVFTKENIYFLAEWTDPTESLSKMPWQKQDDGSWKRLRRQPLGDETEYAEDKFAFLWNIHGSIPKFDDMGCQAICHYLESGKPYGNKRTTHPEERGDLWCWQAVSTNPVGQMDDLYVDNTPYDPVNAPDAGRHGDPKRRGGPYENATPDGSHPRYGTFAPPYWILEGQEEVFNDAEFRPGDKIPGVVAIPFEGDRGDISAKGVYQNGKWTLEIVRKRNTGSKYDIQFTKQGVPYEFGISTFDNAQSRHHIMTGVLKLRLARW
jgi:hypothetical protein